MEVPLTCSVLERRVPGPGRQRTFINSTITRTRPGPELHLFSWLFPDYGAIQKKLSLCQRPSSPQDVSQLYGLLRNAFTLMAMLDYPYSTHFMGSLPANPVKVRRWSGDGPPSPQNQHAVHQQQKLA